MSHRLLSVPLLLVLVPACGMVRAVGQAAGSVIDTVDAATNDLVNPASVKVAGLENLDLYRGEAVVVLPPQTRESLIQEGNSPDMARQIAGINKAYNGNWKTGILNAGLVPHDLELTPEIEAIRGPLYDHVLRGGMDPEAFENAAYEDARYVVAWTANLDAQQAQTMRDGRRWDYVKGSFTADLAVYDPFARTTVASLSYQRDVRADESTSELFEASEAYFNDAMDRFFKEIRARLKSDEE